MFTVPTKISFSYLWPPCVGDADIIFLSCFFLLSFFPHLISPVADCMSTILRHMMWSWSTFRMQVWNVLHVTRWKYRTQKWRKNSPSAHHRTTLSGYIFATKACIDNRKKVVKQQYLLHMSLQYGELHPTSGWDRFGSLGHFSKFQWLSRLCFVTIAALLTSGQPNFARCLAVSWDGTLYIHFCGLLPLTEFCQVQSSLCVQVLRSPILAALLHDTPAAVVSQTLRRGTHKEWNYGAFAEGATYIRLGGHHVGDRPTF